MAVKGSVFLVTEYRVESDPAMKVHYLPEDPGVCAVGEKVEMKFANIVWGLVMLGGAIYLVLYFKQPMDAHETAEQVATEFSKLCVGKHENVPTDARRFQHLDLAWLETPRSWVMDAVGVCHLPGGLSGSGTNDERFGQPGSRCVHSRR